MKTLKPAGHELKKAVRHVLIEMATLRTQRDELRDCVIAYRDIWKNEGKVPGFCKRLDAADAKLKVILARTEPSAP